MNKEEPFSRVAREKKPKKHHFWRRLLLIILAIILIIAGIGFLNLKNTTDKIRADMTRNGNKLLREHKPISILILGIDTGALGRHDTGRTDTMMIMTLNPDTRKTTLVSIPRDIEVNFPNYPQYSPAKINSTYTYGGGKRSYQHR